MIRRIEVIARTERSRKYSEAQKAAILAEADQAGAVLAQGQLFAQQFVDGFDAVDMALER